MKEPAGKLKLAGEAAGSGKSGKNPGDVSGAVPAEGSGTEAGDASPEGTLVDDAEPGEESSKIPVAKPVAEPVATDREHAVEKDRESFSEDLPVDGNEDEDEEEEYEYSNWDEEEEEEFTRPEELVPVFSEKREEPDAAGESGFVEPLGAGDASVPARAAAESLPVAVPVVAGKTGGGRWMALAAGVLAVASVAGVLYAVKEMRVLGDRLERMESVADGGGESGAVAAAADSADGGAGTAAEAAKGGDDVPAKGLESEAAVAMAVDGGVASGNGLPEGNVTAAPGEAKKLEERIDYLERRARLTKLGDEAISSGSRFAFNQLEAEFEKPGLVGLKVAANSEIIRVESMYASTSSMSYREIPVDAIDPTLTSDTEMSIAQLGDVLLASSVPAEARARAAELLAQVRSYDACLMLVECIRTEPNLAVLAQATRSFRKLTGYSGGRVFAGPALGDWFESNRARIKMAFGEEELQGQ